MTDNDRKTETRDVRSADPSLSVEANRLLTEEMQEIVRSDTVEVAPDTPDHSHDEHATHSSAHAALANLRIELVITFFVFAISFGVAAVGTGSVVFLILLVLLLFVGTGAVVKNVLAMTNETEPASPTLGARLKTEGVAHTDAVLSELVDDATQKSPSREDRGAHR